MKALELRKSADENLSTTMKTILDDFTEHLLKEENEIMMQTLEKTTEADLADIALKFQKAKETAPLDPQIPTAA